MLALAVALAPPAMLALAVALAPPAPRSAPKHAPQAPTLTQRVVQRRGSVIAATREETTALVVGSKGAP